MGDLTIPERILRKLSDNVPGLDWLYYRNPSFTGDPIEAGAENIHTFLPAYNGRRKMPASVTSRIRDEYSRNVDVTIDELALYRMRLATVYADGGLVRSSKTGLFCYRQSWNCARVLEKQTAFRTRNLVRPVHISAPVFLLSGLAADNYYHWFHDILPMAFGVREWLPDGSKFLVPWPMKDFHLETFRRLGLEAADLIPMRHRLYTCEELYFSPYSGHECFDHPRIISWLQKELHVPNPPARSEGKRLFISRNKARRRRIINYNEVRPIIEEFGFDEVHCEDLGFSEQVDLFSQAGVILAVHGAGLTNLLFASHGAVVVELHGIPVRDAMHYWSISEARQHSFHVLGCNRAGGDSNDADLRVDPGELRSILGKLCGGSQEDVSGVKES